MQSMNQFHNKMEKPDKDKMLKPSDKKKPSSENIVLK